MGDRASVLALRRSPLQNRAAELAAGSGEQVTVREVPFLAQIGLRAPAGSPSAQALAATLGGRLPEGVGDVGGTSGREVLWLGPDELLLVAPDEADGGPDPAALARELAEALGELPGQVVDLSANRTTLELSGPAAQDVLESSCRIDLDEAAFAVGTARVTLFAKVNVILQRTGPQTWRLLARASFATHLAHWLLDAMREHVLVAGEAGTGAVDAQQEVLA